MSKSEYYANLLLNKLNINSPEDLQLLEEIAWVRGAMVREASLNGAEARLTISTKKAIITIPANQHIYRKRFSIAHEIGHLEMHRYKVSQSLCSSHDMNHWKEISSTSDIELEANEFAAALLLPERFFAKLCLVKEPSLDFVMELAHQFSVSLTATSLRYLYFCNEPCAIIYSQNGCIMWFRRSKDFEELELYINAREKVDSSSLASSLFQGHQICTPKSVPLSSWVQSNRYRNDATIKEHSLFLSNFNAVLTLLWVDDEIEEDDYW